MPRGGAAHLHPPGRHARPAIPVVASAADRCPSGRLDSLLGHLQSTVERIQRHGAPSDEAEWDHVGNALLWLSLPPHRATLVNIWARLRVPLQPLETLAEGLRQLGITTAATLGAWLSALSPDDEQIQAWAQIPHEVQARALHELRSETCIRGAVTRSSDPCQAAEAHEPTCGLCCCPLAGTETQAWPGQCGHVLHLECHLDLFRHAPPDERVYCPTCRIDEAGDPRPTRCAHGNLDRCTLTRDGSRPCGQRCRHNGWSRAVRPSADRPCPVCHREGDAGGNAAPTHGATRGAPDPDAEAPDLSADPSGSSGGEDGHAGMRICVICDDYIDPPERTGPITGLPWPTDECEHWVHGGCLQGDFAPEAEPDCPGCRREGITNCWRDEPPQERPAQPAEPGAGPRRRLGGSGPRHRPPLGHRRTRPRIRG